MMQLVIDEGNTLVKVAVFNQNELVWTETYPTIDTTVLTAIFSNYSISKAIVSSVRKGVEAWQQQLEQHVGIVPFSRSMAYGIQNHYRTPNTLGVDRLAAVTGARHLYPDMDNLIIDAGTCITYDSVDRQGNYYGGSISPGLNMRYQALSHYTAALPLVKIDEGFNNTYGDDTVNAIHSGVQNGILYEVEGFIHNYLKANESANVILTGGDGVFLHTLLKNSIFAGYIKTEPYLVLKGLNAAITKHND
ncbi:type III pantothenate kinase [Mucilaginibacter robiniae]|uniref:Type III pantothenate kinase n=1 Tax=Mucilaginibacter robiniae TaxID=2728022 RepID=A0A7L5E247_9SPHI|nr:type III pantothenate kinase [Mucilaginibacter robiniae]QJD95684.1 type III pantothenate kinase [Mucilaginibacter robiniae]